MSPRRPSTPVGSLFSLRRGGRGLVVAVLLAVSAHAQSPEHRFGLFVGANEGGEGTRPLFSAPRDARRLHDVFVRLGGVKPDDAMLLLDGAADDVTTALGELERRARDAKARGERTTLLFFYSGHAKDGALRLGRDKLALEALKARLAAAPADLRIAVFDTCRSSGAAPPARPGRPPPSFEVETGASRQAPGLTLVTSSAADERDQESEFIDGSVFSYHLATGLLGSADTRGVGRVTLSEALAYAFERTAGSPFAFELGAEGAQVLTEVIAQGEGLLIASGAAPGVYFAVEERGVVAAETSKAGTDRFLALAPGRYTLKRRLGDRLRLAAVEIPAGRVVTVDEGRFRDAKLSDDPVKGLGRSSSLSRHWSASLVGHYQLALGGTFPSMPVVGAEVTLHNLFLRGLALHLEGGYGWASGSLTAPLIGALAFNATLLTLGAGLSWEWFQEGRWIPFAGLNVGLRAVTREFTSAGLANQSYSTFAPGVAAGLKVRVTSRFSIIARGRVHYLYVDVDSPQHLGSADLGLLLDYEFKD